MKAQENTDRLNKLDDGKLIDIVRNYRQYGYDNEFREQAISLLNERGITKEDLQLSGEFENSAYNYAQELYDSFTKNSKITFLMYLLIMITNIWSSFIIGNSNAMGVFALILNWVAVIVYFVFLIKSFMNQHRFYKEINQDYGTESALLYFFLGMPLYVFMYFYFKKQMKESLQSIQ